MGKAIRGNENPNPGRSREKHPKHPIEKSPLRNHTTGGQVRPRLALDAAVRLERALHVRAQVVLVQQRAAQQRGRAAQRGQAQPPPALGEDDARARGGGHAPLHGGGPRAEQQQRRGRHVRVAHGVEHLLLRQKLGVRRARERDQPPRARLELGRAVARHELAQEPQHPERDREQAQPQRELVHEHAAARVREDHARGQHEQVRRGADGEPHAHAQRQRDEGRFPRAAAEQRQLLEHLAPRQQARARAVHAAHGAVQRQRHVHARRERAVDGGHARPDRGRAPPRGEEVGREHAEPRARGVARALAADGHLVEQRGEALGLRA